MPKYFPTTFRTEIEFSQSLKLQSCQNKNLLLTSLFRGFDMCEKNFTTVDLYADTMTSFLLVIFSKIFAKWS